MDWGHNEIFSQECLILYVSRQKSFDILSILALDFGKIPAKLKISLPYYRRLELGDIAVLDLLHSKSQLFHVVGINQIQSSQKNFSPKLYEFKAFVIDLAHKCLEFQSPCPEIFTVVKTILLLENHSHNYMASLSHRLLDLFYKHHGFPIETSSSLSSKLDFLLAQLDVKVYSKTLLDIKIFTC